MVTPVFAFNLVNAVVAMAVIEDHFLTMTMSVVVAGAAVAVPTANSNPETTSKLSAVLEFLLVVVLKTSTINNNLMLISLMVVIISHTITLLTVSHTNHTRNHLPLLNMASPL